MSDSRLRAIARDVALGADPEAHARLLVARLRAGELTLDRLPLLALLRDAEARRFLGSAAPRIPSGVKALFAELVVFGREPCLRAALAIGRVVERYGPRDFKVASLTPTLHALDAAIECPCPTHRAELRAVLAGASGLVDVVAWAGRTALLTDDNDEQALHEWLEIWYPRRYVAGPRAYMLTFGRGGLLRQAVRARLLAWASDARGLG